VATVKCDVCGGIFSQRHLASHKRLAHAKTGLPADATPTVPVTENELIERIASLCKSLSVQGRQRVIRLLNTKNQKDQKKEIP
jgi:hypothetical protein